MARRRQISGAAPLLPLAALALLAGLAGCMASNPYFDQTRAHHTPHGFRNSNAAVTAGDKSLLDILQRRWRGDFRPVRPPEGGYGKFIADWTQPANPTLLAQAPNSVRVTWLGHATVLLQMNGLNILTDPQFSPYAGPWSRFGAQRIVPPPLEVEALPPIDVVLISHNHYDHLDYDTVRRLHAAGQRPRYLVPLGLKAWFADLDEALAEQVTERDWWEEERIGGLRFVLTPAQHWSKRTLLDANRSLWGGWAVEQGGDRPWRFLYTGDTGYSDDFRAIRRRLGPVDLLAVPVGAYEPRDFMAPQHVNPAESVQIALDVEARQVLGVHWGTFELTHEPFDQPLHDVAAALDARGLPRERVWLLRHGESRLLR